MTRMNAAKKNVVFSVISAVCFAAAAVYHLRILLESLKYSLKRISVSGGGLAVDWGSGTDGIKLAVPLICAVLVVLAAAVFAVITAVRRSRAWCAAYMIGCFAAAVSSPLLRRLTMLTDYMFIRFTLGAGTDDAGMASVIAGTCIRFGLFAAAGVTALAAVPAAAAAAGKDRASS